MPTLIDLERKFLLKMLGYPVNVAGKTMDDLRREYYTSMGSAITAPDLVSENPFYIAHRGGGDERPEHTLIAYQGAVAMGAKAVEVSVQMTRDQAHVCFHDTTLDRTTNTTGNIADRLLADLQNNVEVDYGAQYLGVNWDNQSIPTLKETLDVLSGKVVIFLEPKVATGTSVNAIFSLLEKYPEAEVVWKFFRDTGGALPSHAVTAKSKGYYLWMYLDAADNNSVIDTAAATDADYLGLPYDASDASISYMVGKGKPVIVYEVHRKHERDRLTALGVKGMMTPNPGYIRRTTPYATASTFGQGVRAPGDITTDYLLANTPTWSPGDGAITFGTPSVDATLLMGSMSPLGTTYQIDFDMKWVTLPTATTWSGIAFGHVEDEEYKTQGTNNQDGYHAFLRANGQLQLFTHTNGTGTGTQIGGTVATAAPVANTWIPLRVIITPTNVSVQRMDDASAPISVANTFVRGGYFHLIQGTANLAASFRNVVVS